MAEKPAIATSVIRIQVWFMW